MPYLSSIGIPRASAALVAAAVPLVSLTGRFGFGWLGDIFDKRYLMAITYFLTAIGMVALSFASTGAGMFIFVIFFAVALGGGVTLRGAMLSDYFGRSSFGKALGIIMGASAIGGIIGPTLAGLTFDTTGSYRLIWLAYCGLTVISITVILLLKPAATTRPELGNGVS